MKIILGISVLFQNRLTSAHRIILTPFYIFPGLDDNMFSSLILSSTNLQAHYIIEIFDLLKNLTTVTLKF